MNNSVLLREDMDAIATLTLNAPNKLNALSDEMLAALQNELNALNDDRSIRAIVIRGSGKAFCAGHDLKEMTAARASSDNGRAYFKDLFDRCAKMMTTLSKVPQPVIAEIHGIATAAGCQLVANCDLAIAAEGTRFGVNGVNIGLFCSTPMVALSRNIGRKKAFEMLTTGQFISAERAEELGLLNHVVPPETLSERTRDLAGVIASKRASAVKIGKEAFYNQITMTLEDAYAYTGNAMVENLLFRDTEEGIAAFLEKRDPVWQD